METEQIIIGLSDELEVITLKFLSQNIKTIEDSNYILNLILSSHISSLISLMKCIAEDNKGMKIKVDEFINELLTFLSRTYSVSCNKYHREH